VSPGKVSAAVVVQKSALIDDMLEGVAGLPLASLEEFTADARTVAAAESYVRRALEILLDLGRHVVVKGLGKTALEYKDVPRALRAAGILNEVDGAALLEMAGYRNRLVHFYDEVTTPELYEICVRRMDDVRRVRDALLAWLREHAQSVDGDV